MSASGPHAHAVSYNGGGYDWLNGQQTLDSVGAGTPSTPVNPACNNSNVVQVIPVP